jgi:hypothetical protein
MSLRGMPVAEDADCSVAPGRLACDLSLAWTWLQIAITSLHGAVL